MSDIEDVVLKIAKARHARCAARCAGLFRHVLHGSAAARRTMRDGGRRAYVWYALYSFQIEHVNGASLYRMRTFVLAVLDGTFVAGGFICARTARITATHV